MSISQTLIEQTAQQAKAAYQSGDFSAAARLFGEAAKLYTDFHEPLTAAEMENNRSVALLKAGDAKTAWQIVKGTDLIFAEAGDLRRQGMALGNQASALDSLGNLKEAEELYTRSAEVLKQAGEKEMRAVVLESLSALQLRRKDQFGAMATMQAALASKQKLTPRENLLKRLIRLTFQLLNR